MLGEFELNADLIFECNMICALFSQRKSSTVSIESLRDEYEALFGQGTGPLILARTDSLVTDGFGEIAASFARVYSE
jgi:hypothetical protein